MAEPMEIDEAVSLNQLVDQNWSDTEYREPLSGYSYASSSSSFSCGSLTSGSLTPQSSLSASPSRRHSLASAGRSVTTFSTSVIPPSRFATPRTPKKYTDASSSHIFSPQSGYLCAMPTTQSLEDTFPVDPVGISLSGKLQSALGLQRVENLDTNSFPQYDQAQNASELGIFRVENELQIAVPAGNQYEDYALDHGIYQNYQDPFGPSCISEPQQMSLPQTIAPSQTTYKQEDTPPPFLGEPFASPVKPSYGSSSVAQSPSYPGQRQKIERVSDMIASPTAIMPTGSRESRSTSDSNSEDEDDEAPPSIFRKRGRSRKGRVGRCRGSLAKDIQRNVPFIKAEYIKTEPGSQHRCPHCVAERRCFKRQEHLTRHLSSTHGAGEVERCKVPDCGREIVGRPDNMREHYKRTHLYGPAKKTGKKNTWVSVEKARELGLGDIDPRVNPPPAKARKRPRCT